MNLMIAISLNSLYKYLILLFFILSPVLVKAQEDDNAAADTSAAQERPALPKRYYLFSPRLSVTVPHPMGNTSFKKSFVGIYEISVGLNAYLYKGIFIGGTYKTGLLKITENRIPDYNASMYINNAGVKLGTDAYVGEKNRIVFSAAVTAGKNWTSYNGLVAKDSSKVSPSNYSCFYVEPEVNLYFLIESNFGIGATLSYSIFGTNFDPYALSLDDWTQFGTKNSGATQYLSFGFGFYYSFLKKDKQRRGY